MGKPDEYFPFQLESDPGEVGLTPRILRRACSAGCTTSEARTAPAPTSRCSCTASPTIGPRGPRSAGGAGAGTRPRRRPARRPARVRGIGEHEGSSGQPRRGRARHRAGRPPGLSDGPAGRALDGRVPRPGHGEQAPRRRHVGPPGRGRVLLGDPDGAEAVVQPDRPAQGGRGLPFAKRAGDVGPAGLRAHPPCCAGSTSCRSPCGASSPTRGRRTGRSSTARPRHAAAVVPAGRGRTGAGYRPEVEWQRIHCPLVAVFGEKDKLVPIADMVDLRRVCGHAETHLIDNCAHFPHVEMPELAYQYLFDGRAAR